MSSEQDHPPSARIEEWLKECTTTEHDSKAFEGFFQTLIAAGRWCKDTAVSILESLGGIARQIADIIGSAIKSAYDKVVEVIRTAEAWARKNPETTTYIVTYVAIALIAIVTPILLHALGFGEGGVIAGSWAASWQSELAGFIGKGSLFALLQRMGATAFF